MSAFSPGPWRWKPKAERHRTEMPALLDANGNIVCDFGDDTQYYPTEGWAPNKQNKALIAAAPELYDAVIDLLGWDGIDPRAAASARALIARIDGVVQDAAEAPAPPEEP